MTLLDAARTVVSLRPTEGGEHHGPCPACGEGTDRFFVNEKGGIAGTGRFACRRCQTSGNAVDFLTRFLGHSEARARVELGLDTPEDWKKRPHVLGREVRRFAYAAPDGARTHDVIRFEVAADHPLAGTKDGKTYRPAAPDGPHGKRPKVPHFLYRASTVAEAVACGRAVYVCEGEPAAEAVAVLGLCGTSAEGGKGKWRDSYTEMLRGADVVLLPDNDEPGEEHAAFVAPRLFGVAGRVRVLRLPGLPPSGDAVEWVAAGGDPSGRAEELERLAAETPEWEAPSGRGKVSAQDPRYTGQKETGTDSSPRSGASRSALDRLLDCFRTAAELEAEPAPPTTWIARRLFPRGALVQLTGATKGGGKTTFVCYALAAVRQGKPFLGEATERCPVVFCTEQARSTFEPEYLEPAGLLGDEGLHVLYGYEAKGYGFEAVVAAGVEKCKREGAGVLVFDTFGYWAEVEDENDAARVQRKLRPLQDAAASGITVVVVHHDRKGGGETWEAGRGSSAFAGAVDVIVNIRRPQGGQRPEVRELRCEGRYGDLFDSLMIELKPEGYVAHGSSQAVAQAEAERAVKGTLPTSEGDALTMKELRAVVKEQGVGRSTLQRVLDGLTGSGRARVIGEGKRGDPYCYYLPLDEQIGRPEGSAPGASQGGEKVSAHTDGGLGQKEMSTGDGVVGEPPAPIEPWDAEDEAGLSL